MTTLKITGMTCDSCAAHVQEALEKVPGVQSAVVSYAKGAAQLALDAGTAPDALTAAVARLGYKQRWPMPPRPRIAVVCSTRCAAGWVPPTRAATANAHCRSP